MRVLNRIVFILMSLFVGSGFAQAEPIKIAFTQVGESKKAEELSKILVGALSEKTKLQIESIILTDYSTVGDLLKNGKVQFAFLPPAAFVKVDEQGLVKVLLKKVWEGPFYFSTILVRKDSKIKTIADLKGKTVAFVDEKSTSGFLYPKAALLKNKVLMKDLKEVVYSGSHANSVGLLKTKEVDAIAVFSDNEKGQVNAWDKYSNLPKDQVRVIWTSGAISNDPFVVHSSYFKANQADVLKIMLALMEVSTSPEHETYTELIGKQPLAPATSQHYEEVKSLMKQLDEQVGK